VSGFNSHVGRHIEFPYEKNNSPSYILLVIVRSRYKELKTPQPLVKFNISTVGNVIQVSAAVAIPARRSASRPPRSITKIVAQCDKQATVVGRLLTTLATVHVSGKVCPSPEFGTRFQRGIFTFGDIQISFKMQDKCKEAYTKKTSSIPSNILIEIRLVREIQGHTLQLLPLYSTGSRESKLRPT